jgi:hypothetical protein
VPIRWSPAGPSGPRRNDLDGAEHQPMLRAGETAGMSGCLPAAMPALIAHAGASLAGRVPRPGVVVLDPGADPGPGRCPGGEVLSERSSNSKVECQDSMTALSSADPGRPIDWEMPSRAQACRTRPAVYSLPWSVCRMTPGHLAAAHRYRHDQRAVGEPASWCSPSANPSTRGRPCPSPRPGRACLHRWGSRCRRRTTCGSPAAREIPLDQVRRPPAPLPGRVVDRRRFLRRAARPCSRMSAATVFLLTRHPASRRSAVIRGDP